MELGWMRATETGARRLSLSETQEVLAQADDLNLCQVDVPSCYLSPNSSLAASKSVRVMVGADAFAGMSPRGVVTAIRDAVDRFDGRLVIGITSGGTQDARKVSETIETVLADALPLSETSDFPMSPPRPEVLAMPAPGCVPNVGFAASRGFHALSPAWQSASAMSRHWTEIVVGATHATRRARPSRWHVARCVFVSDSAAAIDAYKAGLAHCYFASQGAQRVDVDKVAITGSTAEVADQIATLREHIGPFGVLQVVDPGLDLGDGCKQRDILVRQVLPALRHTDHALERELEVT